MYLELRTVTKDKLDSVKGEEHEIKTITMYIHVPYISDFYRVLK